jgi:hypothetical protein
LAEGIEFKPVSLSHEDSQFLETRQFGVEEIARWFGVPLHKIQSTNKTTSWGSGIEEMNLEFISETLMPWAKTWEQAIARDLILNERDYYAEYNFDAMQRGRLLERYQAYEIALGRFMSGNEVRERENMNRVDGLDVIAPEPAPEPAPEDAEESAAARGLERYRALLWAAAQRVMRKERAAVERMARANGADAAAFTVALASFYGNHGRFVAAVMGCGEQLGADWAERQRQSLEGQPATFFELESLHEWEQKSVDELAQLAEVANG